MSVTSCLRVWGWILVAACLLAVPQRAAATVVEVGAVKDNTIYQDNNGTTSNGAGDYLFAGITQSRRVRRALITFDIAGAGIPAGSTINAVTLTLYHSRSTSAAETVSIHRLTADWGEGTSDATGEEGGGATATPGDATWFHAFSPSILWIAAGGDFDPAASASITIGGPCDLQTDPACGFYNWGSTAAMIADVEGWVNGSVPNYGWILVGREVDRRGAKRFNSRTNPDAATLPVLTIDFTAPGTVGACCLGGGACSELTPAECGNQSGVYQGDGVTCASSPCSQPTGACCAGDGSCAESTSLACGAAGGTYQGDMVACDPNPCPQPTGACCSDSGACSEDTAAACSAGGGTFLGDGSSCAAVTCPVVLTPYLDPLPVPGVAVPATGAPGSAATYDMTIVELQQQVHSELPPTTVWGFDDGVSAPGFPGPTIEAGFGEPVIVNWINDLRDFGTGNPRTGHYLQVDENCIHGAENTAKTVIHLHGGHVAAAADGYPESTFLPGAMDTYDYPNLQLPATLWYHDHALGVTRLNVYMGLAGFYLLRDALESSLNLPSGPYEIPLAIQDRSFNPDGSLSYPAVWQDRFAGDKILVNGKVWPYLQVDQGKYRFRILDGSGSRTYTLSLVPPSGSLDFTVIGTEGGLLEQPAAGVSHLTISPGERYDVVVDFAGFAAGDEILLQNSAPMPYPGTPDVGVIPEVMKFIVVGSAGHIDPLPVVLRPIERLQETDAVQVRDFRLRKGTGDGCGRNPWLINDLGWDDITEYPELGTVEIWRFINDSGVSHPMHMHLVMFQVLDRDTFTLGAGGEILPDGNPLQPDPEESGWKDTAVVGPGEILRVIARFEDYKGKYAYHCHILEHEDHEMMRQFQTVQCGDFGLDPTEGCDDGNRIDWDGCTAGCDVEEFVLFGGTASGTGGGRVDLTVSGELVQANTAAGMTPAEVAQALANAINGDAVLQSLGITATAIGDRVITNGDITLVDIRDLGLTDRLELEVGRTRLFWGNMEAATGYDVVQGDVFALHAGGGDFSDPLVTEACIAANQAATSIEGLPPLAPGQAVWYLLRSRPGGTYDSGGTAQAAPRDAAIGASGNGCP